MICIIGPNTGRKIVVCGAEGNWFSVTGWWDYCWS